jgi:aldehyde:ferredoxin oxidoreductase
MVNPHGADHMDSMIDIFLSDLGTQPNVMIPDAGRLGFEPAPFEGMDPKKVALFKAFQIKRILFDSLVLCDFLPYSYAQVAQLTGAVTGWDTSTMEQFRIAERILTMCRLFNTQEGLSAADDRLPARFFESTKGGPLADKALDFDQMERAKRYYYNLMGWDDAGVPRPEKLADLGIDDLRADATEDAI